MLKTWGEEYDVVVVGGGSAGCALAGRLAAARACRVLLLEAGPVAWAPEILDVASLAATVPGHRRQLGASGRAPHRAASPTVPRGRVLGGSGAVNGAVWMRATPADGWGLPGWTWADMLARYVRSERDADLGDRPGHGVDGPVPVRRPAGRAAPPGRGPVPRRRRDLRVPRGDRQERGRAAGRGARCRATPSTACGSTRRRPT